MKALDRSGGHGFNASWDEKKPLFAPGEGRNERAGNGETTGPALDRR